MDGHKPQLYRWKRESDRTYSKSRNITTGSEIQDWIKKVEDASTRAAEETFGTGSRFNHRSGIKKKISNTLDNVHEYDATHSEAQELLSQWMNEKCDFNNDLGLEEDICVKTPSKAAIKREWDHLLDFDDDDDDTDDVLDETYNQAIKPQNDRVPAWDPYKDLEKQDDKQLVDNILQNLLDKEVVPDKFVNDLGLERNKTTADPRMKMELRHKQVKENREKRERELERERRDKIAKKDAHSQAKQMLMKEDDLKTRKQKKEEMQIQQEMAKIRKELQEERHRQDDIKTREKHDKDEMEGAARLELDQQMIEEERQRSMEEQKMELKRVEIMKKMEIFEARSATTNLKNLRKHFSAWYAIVLNRRIKMGKARAMADWKCLMKAWNAWRAYSRSKKLDRETQLQEYHVKDSQRKNSLACEHYRRHLLRKCFSNWNLWILTQLQEKELSARQNKLQGKMSSLLEAAASGKLWTSRSAKENTDQKTSARSRQSSSAMSLDFTTQLVDDMFAEQGRHQQSQGPLISSRSDLSSSDINTTRKPKEPYKPKLTIPTEPWQVTKRHLNLSTKQMTAMGQGDTTEGNTEGHGKTKNTVSQKPSYQVNSYEHRHKAQLEILRQQQLQIKEQHRMLEDMQFQQQQQFLHQQLNQQHMLQQQFNNMPGVALVPTEDKTKKPLNVAQESSMSKYTTPSSARSDEAKSSRSTVSKTSNASKQSDKFESWVKSMEDRSADRARLKAEREEKRRKQDEEKLDQLKAEEAERLINEEKEKRERIEAHREQKRLQRKREEDKQKHFESMKELQDKAEERHKMSVMRHYGFTPWRKLMEMDRQNMTTAIDQHRVFLQRKHFLAWYQLTQELVEGKERMAKELFNFIIVRRCFNQWKRYGQHIGIQEEKANRFYMERLRVKTFRAWADYTTDEKISMWEKDRRAREHNSSRVLKTVLRAWRRYPKILKAERGKEKRREELRRKVSSILPDFDGIKLLRSSNEQ